MYGFNAYSPTMGPLYLPNPNIPTFMSSVPLNYMDCVLESSSERGALFLGDLVSARKPEVLIQNNIRAILSCGDQSSTYCMRLDEGPLAPGSTAVEDIKVIPALDRYEYDMSQHFDETYQFIEKCLSNKRNTLVHCHAGRSRSATIVTAYLMRKNNWTFEQALAYVKARRPRAKPNDSFVIQLKQFEQKLFPGMASEPKLTELPVADVNGPSTPQKAPRPGTNYEKLEPVSPYSNQQTISMSAPQTSKQNYQFPQASQYPQYPPYNPYQQYPQPNLYNQYSSPANYQQMARQGMFLSQVSPMMNPYRQSSVQPGFSPAVRQPQFGQPNNINPYAAYGGMQWR